jgi:hypothetical protein
MGIYEATINEGLLLRQDEVICMWHNVPGDSSSKDAVVSVGD